MVFLSAVLTECDTDVSLAGCLCFCHVSSRCLLSVGLSFSLLSSWISSSCGVTEPDEGVAGCSQQLCCAFLVTLPHLAGRPFFLSSLVEEISAEITGVALSQRGDGNIFMMRFQQKKRFELLICMDTGNGVA